MYADLAAYTGGGSLLSRETIFDEVSNARGCRWIHVCQNRDDITWTRTDLQHAVHPGCSAAMSKTSHSIGDVILETKSIFAPARIDLPGS